MGATPRLRLHDILPPGEHCHVARARYGPRDRLPVHRHDFVELFWVERGAGSHLINDRTVALNPGDVVFVRASDRHSFRGRARSDLVFVNVAFDASVARRLHERYCRPREPGRERPWRAGALPLHLSLPTDALRALSDEAMRMDGRGRHRLALEAFLLNLLARLDEVGGDRGAGPTPEWLSEAMETFRRPEHLRAGLPRLVKLAHKSPEHVNRTVRAFEGVTATGLVNRLRLDHAARQLRLSDRPIDTIAAECGFANLGYFYRRFKQRFNATPRRYRLQQQAVTGVRR